jgi:hypothetical protein
MKTPIHFAQNLPRLISNPFNITALPLFCVLAFLPSILRLTMFAVPVTNPLAALGPVVAGFWLAASVREIRVSFVLLGSLITTLIWTANWLMMAGGGCCSTLGN